MKTTAKVFIIINLVFSILLLLICTFSPWESLEYTLVGIYGFIVSVGALMSMAGSSKKAVVFWGVLNVPSTLIGAIFMFCIPESDLY